MAFWYPNTAAFIAAVGGVFHGYVGGQIYLGHINGSDLEELTKSLSIVQWQVFTTWLAASAGVLAWFARRQSGSHGLSHHCGERVMRTALYFPWLNRTQPAP